MEGCPARKRWVENIRGMKDRRCRPTASAVHFRAEIDVDVKWCTNFERDNRSRDG